MPKIEISTALLAEYLGEELALDRLEDLLPLAKAELDSTDEAGSFIKIEFNDTNRPDLWSAAGLARQIRPKLHGRSHSYDFLSRGPKAADSGLRELHVDSSVQGVRPYIAAFAAEGRPVDDLFLQTLIQSQEKLCSNYGRKRSSIAMGIYAADRIAYPVTYRGAQPESTYFTPLEMDSEMSLKQIVENHPKGIEYGHIITGYDRYPYLEDNRGNCLSMPPIINSNYCGSVEVGQKSLFVELTGTDITSVLTATSIIACDMSDAGYRILPVKVVYPYQTTYGKEVTTPYHFQDDCSVDIDYIRKMLGEPLSVDDISGHLKEMGHEVTLEGERVSITVPPYRNDFMHAVDIVEEIMIGRGVESFEPVLPEEFTVGRFSQMEETSRRVRDVMLGLGYQEMLYNYLGSREEFVERMCVDPRDIIEIENPMTENYQMVRNSIIPDLLGSEALSRNAAYPHRIFEIGCVAIKDASDLSGTVTKHNIGILLADAVAGFNEINTHISALMFYLNAEPSMIPAQDQRFIEGRCVDIHIHGHKCGIMGELHPRILENWSIDMPCAAAEIDISQFMPT